MATAVLYDYFRSSASYRVRIALNLKGVDYEHRPVNLAEGEQKDPAYHELNPQNFVPMLEIDGHRLTQSLAIIVYLDQKFPDPALMPADPVAGAHVRALAMTVACDIHPLNNLRVLKYLRGEFGAEQESTDRWAETWIAQGFDALEAMIGLHGGRFAFGDSLTTVDCHVVPQVYSAQRFNVDCARWPRLLAAVENAMAEDPVAAAHPDRQPDAD